MAGRINRRSTRRRALALLVSASILAPSATTLFVEPAQGFPGAADPRRPLTAKERRRTKRIAGRHPLFKQIVAGRSYRYEMIIGWGSFDRKRRRERRIGTYSWVELTPALPLLTATWPLLCYPKDGSSSYVRWHAELTLHDLRKIALNVDLRKGKLVGLAPEDASGIDFQPGLESPCGPSEPD
jgi:hypothetical protein